MGYKRHKIMAQPVVYILTEHYAGEKKIVAVCTNYAKAKEIAREWFDYEVENLSQLNELETEFRMPETHEGFWMREEVYCDISIRDKNSNAAKYLFIEAFGVNDFCN